MHIIQHCNETFFSVCSLYSHQSFFCMLTTGKYLTIPRTEGISTTDIVGRMLLMTRDHHSTNLPTIEEEGAAPQSAAHNTSSSSTGSANSSAGSGAGGSGGVSGASPTHASYKLASSGTGAVPVDTVVSSVSATAAPMPFIRKSRFLTTSRTIRLFGAGVTVRVGVCCIFVFDCPCCFAVSFNVWFVCGTFVYL